MCLLLITDILFMFQLPLTPHQGMVFTIYSGDTWKCTWPQIKWIPLSTRSDLHPNFLQAPEFPATPLPGQTFSPFSRLTPGPVSTFSSAITSSQKPLLLSSLQFHTLSWFQIPSICYGLPNLNLQSSFLLSLRHVCIIVCSIASLGWHLKLNMPKSNSSPLLQRTQTQF